MLVNIEGVAKSTRESLMESGCLNLCSDDYESEIFFIPKGIVVEKCKLYDGAFSIKVDGNHGAFFVTVDIIETTETQKYLPLAISSRQAGDTTGTLS